MIAIRRSVAHCRPPRSIALCNSPIARLRSPRISAISLNKRGTALQRGRSVSTSTRRCLASSRSTPSSTDMDTPTASPSNRSRRRSSTRATSFTALPYRPLASSGWAIVTRDSAWAWIAAKSSSINPRSMSVMKLVRSSPLSLDMLVATRRAPSTSPTWRNAETNSCLTLPPAVADSPAARSSTSSNRRMASLCGNSRAIRTAARSISAAFRSSSGAPSMTCTAESPPSNTAR